VFATEQRKAALRKVEIELDEADDIVSPFSSPSSSQMPIKVGVGITT